ncbi:MAG: hypothetical protein IJ683_08130 [Butyrivibrio sp.]|nr:hypothetical protein [Butyrivibrio sp.]MBR1642272.1 hypothetical protein [Butyrivibrio sp.]
MENKRSSQLSLFLMELIVAIMFFSLSAAVCVRLFASAHILAEKTGNLESAIMWTQNLSEVYVSKNGDLEQIASLYTDAYLSKSSEDDTTSSLILIFDKDWEPMEKGLSDAAYEVILSSSVKDAKDVYADVNTYGVELVGKAASGTIAVLDIRGRSEILSDIPKDSSLIFYQSSIDTYIGKEEE